MSDSIEKFRIVPNKIKLNIIKQTDKTVNNILAKTELNTRKIKLNIVKPREKTINTVSSKSETNEDDDNEDDDNVDDNIDDDIVDKNTIDKKRNDIFRSIDWPQLINRNKSELREYFNDIWIRMMNMIHNRKLNKNMETYYISKVVNYILSEELNYIHSERLERLKRIDNKLNISHEPITGYFFKEENDIKKKQDLISTTMYCNLIPRIKQERVAVFQDLVRKSLKKYEGQQINLAMIISAVGKVLDIFLDDVDKNFEYGRCYGLDEIQYLKSNIREVVDYNTIFLADAFLSAVITIPTTPPTSTNKINSSQVQEKTALQNLRYDYSESINTKKEDYIPKIIKFYQDDAVRMKKLQIKILSENYRNSHELDDDYPIPKEKKNEIMKQALDYVYQHFKTHKPEAIKKKAIITTSKQPSPSLVKDFILNNYIINPPDRSGGTCSCDIYKKYEEWMKHFHPEEPIMSNIIFGRTLGNSTIMGVTIQKHCNGQRQGWRIFLKNEDT